MRTDGEITKEEYKAEREKIEKALTELNEEYERMLATEEATKAPDICWDKIRCSLEEMIDFSKPQIDRRVIKKFVSKIVPNGKNHFRWYMNLDGNDTTALDMVTEGRKSHAVISFNEDEEGEPPLHNGTVIWFKDIISLFANSLENATHCAILNGQSEEVDEKKSSIISILHRQLLTNKETCSGQQLTIEETRALVRRILDLIN